MSASGVPLPHSTSLEHIQGLALKRSIFLECLLTTCKPATEPTPALYRVSHVPLADMLASFWERAAEQQGQKRPRSGLVGSPTHGQLPTSPQILISSAKGEFCMAWLSQRSSSAVSQAHRHMDGAHQCLCLGCRGHRAGGCPSSSCFRILVSLGCSLLGSSQQGYQLI